MIVDVSFDIMEYTLNSIYKPFTSWNYIFFIGNKGISEPYVLKILFPPPQAFGTPLCASLVLLISLADFSAV